MLRSTSTPAVERRLITVSTARVQASAPARSTTRCTCVAYVGFRCCRFALAGYCSLRSCTTLGWCCSLGCCRGPPAGWLHTSGPAPGARVRLSLCCAGWRRSGTLPNVLLNVRSGLPRRSNRLFSRNYASALFVRFYALFGSGSFDHKECPKLGIPLLGLKRHAFFLFPASEKENSNSLTLNLANEDRWTLEREKRDERRRLGA